MTRRRLYKFARRSARHDLTVSIDDLDVQMGMDAADRADASLGRLIA
jgi:hypothetical protein